MAQRDKKKRLDTYKEKRVRGIERKREKRPNGIEMNIRVQYISNTHAVYKRIFVHSLFPLHVLFSPLPFRWIIRLLVTGQMRKLPATIESTQ